MSTNLRPSRIASSTPSPIGADVSWMRSSTFQLKTASPISKLSDFRLRLEMVEKPADVQSAFDTFEPVDAGRVGSDVSAVACTEILFTRLVFARFRR